MALYRSGVLAGPRCNPPPAPEPEQAWGESSGFLPAVTGVHVYTSTFSAHGSSTPQGRFFTLRPLGGDGTPPSQLLAAISSAPFSTADLLGTPGSS